MPTRLFHVSSARNRGSIARFGLDWRRMGAAPGIAGATRPEVDGVFLCGDEFTVDFFVRMNNTGGPVDVWAVAGVDADALVESANGFVHLPATVPAAAVTLLEPDATRPGPRRSA